MVNLSDRRGNIIEYVTSNPMCTKADVIRYMEDNGSSVMTTHSILKDLELETVIKILKDKPNSQTHHLVINDQNEYNKIQSTVAEIECIIEKMDEFIPNLRKTVENAIKKRINISGKLLDLESRIEPFCTETISRILQIILIQVDRNVFSEKDSQILYGKIIALMLKVDKYNSRLTTPSSINIHSINLFTFKNSKPIQDYVKRNKLNTNLIDEIIAKSNDIDRMFLDN